MAQRARQTQRPGSGRAGEPGPRVLVVHDSPWAVRKLARLLSEAGFSAETVGSGQEALSRCSKRAYAAVVSDVDVGTVGGVQLCKLLAATPTTNQVPVVLLNDQPRARLLGRHAGARAQLRTHDAEKQLAPLVARILQSRTVQSTPPTAGITGLDEAGPSAGSRRTNEVLDELLLERAIAREVHKIGERLEDRKTFLRDVLDLAAAVSRHGYLSVTLEGRAGPTWAVHARDAWPEHTDDRALAAMGILEARGNDVEVIRGDSCDRCDRLRTGAMVRVSMMHRDTVLGELRAFGGLRPLGPADVRALEILGAELSPVLRMLFLLEDANPQG